MKSTVIRGSSSGMVHITGTGSTRITSSAGLVHRTGTGRTGGRTPRRGSIRLRIKPGTPLPPTAVKLLRIMRHVTTPLTRRELARQLGKSYLMRFDIQCLVRLVDQDLVIETGITRAERFGMSAPSNYHGANISLASVLFTYELNPYRRAMVDRIIYPSISRQPEPTNPLQTSEETFLDRIKKKIGL